MLFHNINNTFSSGFVGQMFSGADSVNQAWQRLTLWGLVAIVLVLVYGSQNLSRKHQKQVEPVEPEVSAAAANDDYGWLMEAEWRPLTPDGARSHRTAMRPSRSLSFD